MKKNKNYPNILDDTNVLSSAMKSVRVFTGSDLITRSDRIGLDRAQNWLFSSFLKHFFIISIMFIK